MRRHFIFTLLALFLLLNRASAQTSFDPTTFSYGTTQMDFKSQRVVPPSPDAAELGRYGNVPVSLFTGTPNISIPLYDLKGHNLDVPISLSYNAGGFRPQDLASWVGLGWSLNAGGVITRSVVANPDNATNYFYPNNNYSTPPNVSNLFAEYDYMDSIQKEYKETQPDVYYYKFGNYSGKFFLGTNQNVIRKEKNNLKITESGVPSDNSGTSFFTIVDENGNTYVFAATEVSNMLLNDAISQDQPVQINYMYPSSWFLTSITSADRTEQVQFTYYKCSGTQIQFNNFLAGGSYSWYHNTIVNSSQDYEGSSGSNVGTPPTVTIYGRRYLQGITYIKGGQTVATINFESLTNQRLDLNHTTDFPGEQLLQDIKVSSENGLVKRYNFYYSYFSNPNYSTDPYHSRLRLDSVSEAPTDGSGLYKPPYSFVYNSGTIPSVNQAGIDSWGFFNGPDMVSNLIPTYNLDGTNYGGTANRSPDLTSTTTTMLTQLNYPTGGYTSFSYEQNATKDINNNLIPIGGVRILKLTDYVSSTQPATVKNYQYVLADGTSSGDAVIPIFTSNNTYHHYAEIVQGGCGSGDNRCSDYYMNFLNVSASAVYGLGTFQGSHIGYSLVTETQSNVNTGALLGKTVYNYYVATPNAYDDNINSGDLMEETIYNANGKLLEDIVNTYNYTASGDGTLVGYTVSSHCNQDDNTELCQYLSQGNTEYTWIQTTTTSPTCQADRIYSSKLTYLGYTLNGQYQQLSQTTDTKYDQQSNNYTVTTKKYTYGNPLHTFPTLIEDYTSNNDELVTIKKYAADYTVPTSGQLDVPTSAIKLLQSYNMVGREVETVHYRQNLNGTNVRYIDGVLNFYSSVFPYVTNVSHLELSAPLTTIQASTTNGTFSYDPNYVPLGSFLYDANGNLTQQVKVGGKATSYIWDYQGLLPTAEIVNAAGYLTAYTGFENGGSGGNWSGYSSANVTAGGAAGSSSYNLSSSNTLSVIGLSGSRQFVVSFWLRTGSGSVTVSSNIGTATAVQGASYSGWTYYEYLIPANSSQVSVTGNTSANIDELRLFPKDAQMTTYTYNPLIGTTSQCTMGNQTTYYTYDGFGRLRYVKDLSGNIIKTYEYHYQGH